MMQLRWYQEEAVQAIFNHFQKPTRFGNHPLIVLPTGSGKSFVIAEFCKRTLQQWPDQHVLVLTHQQELVEQNEQELKTIWPEAPADVYSAGLKRKVIAQITFASIQSIHRKPEEFEHFDIIMVDEAHLIPFKDDSMYRKLLSHVDVPVIGLTATPFRLNAGKLTEGDDALFTDVAYDVSSGEQFVRLVDEGFLCKLVTKQTKSEINTDKLNIRGGEFIPKQLSDAADQEAITHAAIEEVMQYGKDRKSWLIFAVDIKHAEHITQRLLEKGISASVVHSKMKGSRDEVLEDFKAGKLRAVVNVNVLTTGFNHKGVDLIVLLRPTASAVLHAQMIGRGLRVLPGKEDCLVLDFAGNTKRLGPINDLQITKKRKGKKGKPITKTCPSCSSIVHGSVRICPDCAHVFEFQQKLKASADNVELIKRKIEPREPQWFNVDDVTFSKHTKPGKPPSLKVAYRVGLRIFNEWVCFEHTGYARRKAERWWYLKTGDYNAPKTIDEAIEALTEGEKCATRIQVDDNGKYPIILDFKTHELDNAKPIAPSF